MRNDNGEIIKKTEHVRKIIRSYFLQRCANKCEDLDERVLTWENIITQTDPVDTSSLHKPISIGRKQIEKSLTLYSFTGEYYQIFKEWIVSMLHQLFQRIEKDRNRKIMP